MIFKLNNIISCLFVLLVIQVQCSEWMTSGGYHCIERCQESVRRMDNVEWSSVYTCPVVDGIQYILNIIFSFIVDCSV